MNSESAAPKGIICKRCKGVLWKVDKTRHLPGRIVRVRTCKTCHLPIRTAERLEAVIGDAAPDGAVTPQL